MSVVSCGPEKSAVVQPPASATSAQREVDYWNDLYRVFNRPVTTKELARFEKSAAIEQLFEDLKSSNQDPNSRRREWPDGYPRSFDFKAQMRVHEAERILIALGTNAFPYLIEHSDDNAYSKSDWYADLLSFSVGEVCFQIIERQIELAEKGYKAGRRGLDGAYHDYRSYFTSRLWLSGDPAEMGRKERLKRWWNSQKNRPLKEIQIEALQYAVTNEEAIGFPGGDSERQRFMGRMVKRLKELKDS